MCLIVSLDLESTTGVDIRRPGSMRVLASKDPPSSDSALVECAALPLWSLLLHSAHPPFHPALFAVHSLQGLWVLLLVQVEMSVLAHRGRMVLLPSARPLI